MPPLIQINQSLNWVGFPFNWLTSVLLKILNSPTSSHNRLIERAHQYFSCSSIRTSKAYWSSLCNSTSSCYHFQVLRLHQVRLYDIILAHVKIVHSNAIIFHVTTFCTRIINQYVIIITLPILLHTSKMNEPQYMTLPCEYNCCILSRRPPYIFITTSHNLCDICIHSTGKFNLIALLCTHVNSYILWKVHPLVIGLADRLRQGRNINYLIKK